MTPYFLVPNFNILNFSIIDMVSTLKSNKSQKTVDVTLTLHNIFDIINGLNILIGNKERDIQRFGDGVDKDQLQRYKKLLAEMQQAKGLIK